MVSGLAPGKPNPALSRHSARWEEICLHSTPDRRKQERTNSLRRRSGSNIGVPILSSAPAHILPPQVLRHENKTERYPTCRASLSSDSNP